MKARLTLEFNTERESSVLTGFISNRSSLFISKQKNDYLIEILFP